MHLNFKSKISTIFLVFFTFYSNAQYGNLHIETRFDQVYTQLFGPIYNISSTTNNTTAQGSMIWNKSNHYVYDGFNANGDPINGESEDMIGSYRSGSLEALLRMYETTCDMKYIWEFMERATEIYDMRADRFGYSTHPFMFIDAVEWHGRILLPLAHFVYLVKSSPFINNTSIPLSHQVNFKNKLTIGLFADMLNVNNKEMMDYLLNTRGLWRTNEECMCEVSTINHGCQTVVGNVKKIGQLNFQAPYGCALIYLYLANQTRTDYGVKAVEMARAYLINYGGILEYIPSHNAYKWYHDGFQLRQQTLFSNVWSIYKHFYEDIGHGSMDITFPILYNKYYSSITGTITGNQYFEDYQMVRFKNTFSRQIYNYSAPNIQQTYSIGNTFSCSVFNICGILSPIDNQNFADHQMDAKSWIDLYKFDNVSGSVGDKVYDILMNFYINVESNFPINATNYSGQNIVGLAGLCAANRTKENILCVSYPPKYSSLLNEVSFYFNENNNTLNVNCDEKISKIIVTDIMGKEIKLINIENSLDFTNCDKGKYIIHVYFENDTKTSNTFVFNK